jgi:hypothetical protein
LLIKFMYFHILQSKLVLAGTLLDLVKKGRRWP